MHQRRSRDHTRAEHRARYRLREAHTGRLLQPVVTGRTASLLATTAAAAAAAAAAVSLSSRVGTVKVCSQRTN